MKKTNNRLVFVFLTIISLMFAGCGSNSSGPAALNISTPSLPAGTVGTVYSQTLAATGGTSPYTWAVSAGSLPTGLTLNTSTGVISGTPTVIGGPTSFTVSVTDAAAATVSQALSITVTAAGAALSITTASPLASATFGTAYSQTLAATGGTSPYTWAVSVGSLPTGLNLNTSTGVISGTPTAPAAPNLTTSNFTVGVTDAVAGGATKALAITASLSASALAGKAIYDNPCAGCHRLGIFDTSGSPDLSGRSSVVITRFVVGTTNHNGVNVTFTATDITNVTAFISLY